MDEKPSSDQIVFRSLFGGVLWGMGWSLILCVLSGTSTPFITMVMYGLILGIVFGLVNGLLLVVGMHSLSLMMTCVLAAIFSYNASFASLRFEYLFANILAGVVGSISITYYALQPINQWCKSLVLTVL